jgi:hypothetical protein
MGNPDASWWYDARGIMPEKRPFRSTSANSRAGLEVIANQLSKELAEDNPVSPVVRDESAFILVPTTVPIRENEYATA